MSVITEKPIVTKISDEIFTRLETLITEPNDAFTFTNVVRPTKIATYTPAHGLIVLTRGEITRVNDLDCPGNPPAVALTQQFNIRLILMPSERNQDAIDTLLNQFASDVRKCICQPASSWHTFDGNALYANFGPQIVFTSDGGVDGANMQLLVTYRVSEDDPTERR